MNQVLHSTPALTTLGSDYPMQSSDSECIGNINNTHHGFSTDHQLRRDGTLNQSASSFLPLSSGSASRYIPHRPATHEAQYHTGAGISDSNSGSISTSPSSNASSLVSSFYSQTQTGLGVSTAPQLFAPSTGYPTTFGSLTGLRHRGTSITDHYSNPAMLPPARSPGVGNPVSPSLGATVRDNYTTSAPHLPRHALSPRSHTDSFARPFYNSLPDAPRTVLSANLPMSPPTGAHYNAASSLLSYPQAQHGRPETPPFDEQVTLLELAYEDRNVTPKIEAKIEKGFFWSGDEVWTCYRRNYFSVQCSYTLDPHISNARLYVNRGGSKAPEQVQALAVSLSAVVDGANGKSIELIQHTPKRDKGPQLPINKEKVLPTPPGKNNTEPHGYPLTSFHTQTTIQPPYLPLQSEHETSSHNACQPTGHPTSQYSHTFERIQFKSATANNGKRRAQQQYYHLIVELWADLRRAGDSQPHWHKLAHKVSAAVVVRGRSPSHYSNESSTGTSRQGGAGGTPGPGHSSFGSTIASSFGRGGTGLSMLGGSSYGSAYRSGGYSLNPSPIGSHSVSSASSISGGHVDGLTADHPMEDAETKSIDNYNGYQYFPQPIYEAGLVKPGQSSPAYDDDRRMKDDHAVAGFASGFSTGSCGRYIGTETSRGYYPDLPASY